MAAAKAWAMAEVEGRVAEKVVDRPKGWRKSEFPKISHGSEGRFLSLATFARGPRFGDDLEILQELLRHAVTLLQANRQDVCLIRLPTRPALSSLNVSNTVAVALYESVRDDSEQN
jgi:hypothetical protein